MTTHVWTPAAQPPSSNARIMLRFDPDGERDCEGFYWRYRCAWYKSVDDMCRGESVHPVAWREP